MKISNPILSLFLVCLLASCAGYNKGMRQYQSLVYSSQYAEAASQLEKIDALQHARNRFLYLAEKGRLARLLGNLDSSNHYLNEADNLLEETYKTVGQTIASNLVNPLQETYLAADYERFMLHYYKALNYLALHDNEGAVVEARRITLQANRLADKKMLTPDGPGIFAYTLQGIIYEQAGQINDAFVSYRNAIDLAKPDGQLPDQLLPAAEGLLATAKLMGFTSEYNKYSSQFNINLPGKTVGAGSLLVLHDAGWSPQKEEQVFSFNSWLPGQTDLEFADPYRQNLIAVPAAEFSTVNSGLSPNWFMGLRVAMAVPKPRSPSSWTGAIQLDSNSVAFKKIQDLNTLATRPSIMKQELVKSILRALAKKAVEVGAQQAGKAIAKGAEKKDTDPKKTDQQKQAEQKKKDDQAAVIGAGVGLLVNLVNQATEHADTRSWLTLPAAIYAIRVPLKLGANVITLSDGGVSKTIEVAGKAGLQVLYW